MRTLVRLRLSRHVDHCDRLLAQPRAKQVCSDVATAASRQNVRTSRCPSPGQSTGIAGLLDEQVSAFGERPLEGRYPYVFVDAKVRHEALLVRAGCKTLPSVRRSGLVKLRAA